MKTLPLLMFSTLLGVLVSPVANAALIFTAVLVGANEVPAQPSPGTGSVMLTLEDDLVTLDVFEVFSDLTSNASAAHLHCCVPAGSNGPVALPYTSFPSTTSGTYTNTFNLTTALINGVTAATFIAALESGQVYANIHTVNFPGGEIRGQLVQVVPEPIPLLLLAIGLVALAYIRRKRD